MLGRLALWACVGMLLVRGIGDVLSAPTPAVPTPTPGATVVPSFPDPEARAVAVRFARSYLSVGKDGRGAHRVRALMAESLSDQAAPVVPSRGSGARVAFATVAREVSLGKSRALITVASFMTDGRTRYLTVPVARDANGGLIVDDLPALSAAPAVGSVAAIEPVALAGLDGEAVEDLIRRFLAVYLEGGDERTLAFYLAPGTRIASLPAGLEVETIEAVDRSERISADVMGVAATVLVRDAATGTRYRLRYRIKVQRTGRWYVTGVLGAPSS